ncbi:STAS domain-containing protein [Lichenifustis flavocetrariae]|uniref:STAS domain-containing protein n=1 Tax=Lichenifustis flavocetrariae TaxID=2949735 RepID=A0AA42CHU7_9HYPH|nr:STAS domain-containing protein [Lichenifustis flavocetrariae]MCW6507654.1 STAS domain-containing protein [Lichenifustis flavocetrariae]
MPIISSDPSTAPHALVLDETLDLNAASELARTFSSLRGTPVTVDPSHVGRVGAQCIQVLIAASKSWAADNVYFTVTPGSEPFNEGLDLLGLTSFFSNERVYS